MYDTQTMQDDKIGEDENQTKEDENQTKEDENQTKKTKIRLVYGLWSVVWSL